MTVSVMLVVEEKFDTETPKMTKGSVLSHFTPVRSCKSWTFAVLTLSILQGASFRIKATLLL